VLMDYEKIKKGVRLILEGIGEDPNRPGLRETPDRIARMCDEIFAGLGKDPAAQLKVIKGETYDEMVIVKDIPMYSLCEHHLLPFIGVANIAYIPQEGRIVGISKLSRVLETLSRRPQIQERLTTELADLIERTIKPLGVMVVIEAEHLCMTMRGVKKPGSVVVTSAVLGAFREEKATREEAITLIRTKSGIGTTR
jgi:GTP cyclohydrolase I